MTEQKAFLGGGIQEPHFHSGESPPTSMVRHLGRDFERLWTKKDAEEIVAVVLWYFRPNISIK